MTSTASEQDVDTVRAAYAAIYQQTCQAGFSQTVARTDADKLVAEQMENGTLPRLPLMSCGCVEGRPHGSCSPVGGVCDEPATVKTLHLERGGTG